MNVKCLILSSELRTFKFDDGRTLSKNHVVYAFEDNPQTDDYVGLCVYNCNISAESYDITKKLKPNEYVNIRLDRKRDRNNPNNFSFIIGSINSVEV